MPMTQYWWDDFALAEGEVVDYEIGQLRLCLARHERDWLLAWRHDFSVTDPESRFRLSRGSDFPELPADCSRLRIGRSTAGAALQLLPRTG